MEKNAGSATCTVVTRVTGGRPGGGENLTQATSSLSLPFSAIRSKEFVPAHPQSTIDNGSNPARLTG